MIARCPRLFASIAPRAFHLVGLTRRELAALAEDLQALRAQGAVAVANTLQPLYTPAAIDRELVARLHGDEDVNDATATLYTPDAIDRSLLAVWT